ncbi:MAG: DUF58 domain-containing protein [Planctomycetes bacterium]|nr:DUF58 domain-containing protein [Planctomycetota bacterium]
MEQAETLFPPSFLRQLEALDAALLRLRGSVGEGLRAAGRTQGQSEFRGHRPYSPGDDLRRLDWNAYGRLGKFFMREYERERSEHVTILLDCSRSMAAGSPPKHLLARRAAAAFGYLALKRGGTTTLVGQSPVEGVSRFNKLLDQLSAATPTQDVGTQAQAAALLARGRSPSDLVVITDALEPLESLSPLWALGEKRTAVTLVQILSPDELEPKPGGMLELHGLEENRSLKVAVDASMVASYQRELEKHLESIESIAHRHGWTLALTDSAADLRELFIGKLLAAGAAR